MTNEPYDLDLNSHNTSTPNDVVNKTGINESEENISIPPGEIKLDASLFLIQCNSTRYSYIVENIT